MMLRSLGRRIASALAFYLWLWRAAHSSASSWPTGTLRFVACVLEDTFLLGVWCLNSPLTRPVQRDRVVVPTLAVLTVMMLSLKVDPGPQVTPTGPAVIPDQVSAVCGGAFTLGAITNPGDELVAFEACADAFTSTNVECEFCDTSAPSRSSPLSFEQRRFGLTT